MSPTKTQDTYLTIVFFFSTAFAVFYPTSSFLYPPSTFIYAPHYFSLPTLFNRDKRVLYSAVTYCDALSGCMNVHCNRPIRPDQPFPPLDPPPPAPISRGRHRGMVGA